MPAIAGASILPLKQRCAGRSLAGLGADQDRLRGVDRERRRRRDAGLALVVDGKGALQRLLADAQHAGARVGARPDAIPGVGAQGLADRDPGVADLERHALGRQHQREARAGLADRGARSRSAVRRPAGSARSAPRPTAPAAWQSVAAPSTMRVGAGPGVLDLRGEAAVELLGMILELGAAAGGIGIAANDADQRGVERAGPAARDLEGDRLAGAYRDAVGVADERCSHVVSPSSADIVAALQERIAMAKNLGRRTFAGRCNRRATARAARLGAGLSQQADPHDRAVRARRHDRPAGPHRRRASAERLGRQCRGREQERRRRQHRRGAGRQGAARRLHAAARHGRHRRHQPVPLQEDAVRHARRPSRRSRCSARSPTCSP